MTGSSFGLGTVAKTNCTTSDAGSGEAAELHARAWALLFNFAPWSPQTVRANGGEWRSPAERLNKHRYHDNWLQNLLVSASLASFRHKSTPQTPA